MQPDYHKDNPETNRAEEATQLEPAQHQLLLEARAVIEDLHSSNTRAAEFIRKIARLEGEAHQMPTQGGVWAKALSNYAKGGTAADEH